MSFAEFFLRPPHSSGSEPHYTPSIRAERLVVIGRVALASASLAAVWLDPSAPSRYAALAYGLMSVYAIYALAIAMFTWRRGTRSTGWRLVTHIVDLSLFTAVIYLTEGATSPFFLYFIFSLLSATLRFRLRGTFWTAVASLAIFIGMGVWASLVLHDPDFELNRFLVRSVYLSIAGVLLIYLSVHQEQHRHELWRLSDWPRSLPEDLSVLMTSLLRHAAATMRTARTAILWQKREEEQKRLTWIDGEQWHSEWWDEPAIAAELEPFDFYCRDLDVANPMVVRTTEKDSQLFLRALSDRLVQRLDPSNVLSVRLSGTRITGRLFVFDTRDVTSDDMVLCRIVGETMAARLDEFFLLQEVRNSAVVDERIRVSRELHDGVLQSLTGISLQLKVAERVLAAEPDRAITILGQVRDLIVRNQRELRDFVQSLREQDPPSGEAPLSLRLMAVAERARVEWSVRVALEIEEEGLIRPDVARQVALLVNEAISNAGRHGEADLVQVRVRVDAESLTLRISDNGKGFPFSGRFDLGELDRRSIGPLTLRERVSALGGALVLESSRRGASLDIAIPLAATSEMSAGSDV